MVLVLNKIDLVPPEVVGSWLTVLRRSHPTIAMAASSQNHQIATQVTVDALLQLLKNYARNGKHTKSKTVITVGMIGYPNTGKSSIINALKRTRAVGVSPKPSHTVAMQEVVLDRHVRLLDSPGIAAPPCSATALTASGSPITSRPSRPSSGAARRPDCKWCGRCHPDSATGTYRFNS
jgi:nuclear GTP-binding protein